MATHRVLAPSAAGRTFDLIRVLSIGWLDRAIASVACLPLIYLVYYRYVHMHQGFPLIALSLNMLILIVTMIIRRPPKRVTPNPLYWLLAFVATYWQTMILTFLQQGRPLVAGWITNSLAAIGLAIVVWARMSLGRNIGFVPAQRELVDTGAYRYMRHPVYTSILFSHTAFVLHAFSPLNTLLVGLGVFWFVPVKSLVEEKFLREDPHYVTYMRSVRARWIPFLI
jgi:protein-S-isoprenylcysteine O-methyltransferase Ste14